MTAGSLIFPLAALMASGMVNLCLGFLPHSAR